ncbi:MAG: histidine ammonia-lyase [Anaerolineae bacterium]
MGSVALDGESLTLEEVALVGSDQSVAVSLSGEARERVARGAQTVQELVAQGRVAYGITTGFGKMADRQIPPDQVAELQRNILISHAVGTGPLLDRAAVRAALLIRANTLAKGHSGVRLETIELLLEMLNRGVHPAIPSQGSLGASGDLAPLAHMGLVLIGLGEAEYEGTLLPGGEALTAADLIPVTLTAKEGLALTNGTAIMTALAALITVQAENVIRIADVVGCMSLEALAGTAEPFDARIHELRPHPRQIDCASDLRAILKGSGLLRSSDRGRVQDAYSLRCMPQVHGAVRDVATYARWASGIELNSATDNPLVFWDEGPEVLSGGNFHGEPVALALDYLGLALAELGNLSERRTARLLDPALNEGILPTFLTEKSGLHSGFMLAQYTAAALASENRMLAHPASADSVSVSAGIEDHASLGVQAALRAQEALRNVETILAIELLCAAQALDFRRKGSDGIPLGRGTDPAYAAVRERVDFMERDEVLAPRIEAARQLVASGELRRSVEQVMGGVPGDAGGLGRFGEAPPA